MNRTTLSLLAIAAISLSGCYGRDFSMDYVESIEIGVTTKQEVVAALGKPYLTRSSGKIDCWFYQYCAWNRIKYAIMNFNSKNVVGHLESGMGPKEALEGQTISWSYDETEE